MQIYTCGTEKLQSAEQLINTMHLYGVNVVFDARNKNEITRSWGMSEFDLKEKMPISGIRYVNASNGLSCNVSEGKYLHSRGHVDFMKYRDSLAFKTMIRNILNCAIYSNLTVCILGYREDVTRCHRFFISSELKREGATVLHIGPGFPVSHADLEQQEVESMFPELDQIPMFGIEAPKKPYEEKLTELLKAMNRELGPGWIT